MSGFNTKECNNNGEYEITFYSDNRDDFKTVENLCRSLIGHNKPNAEGNLISRSALQKSYHEECIGDCYVCKRYKVIKDSENEGISHCLLIDDAPTVDLWQMRQEATENALKKAEVLYSRPKGEWRFNERGSFYCSVCNGEPYDQYATTAFCPLCGADMKGGAE